MNPYEVLGVPENADEATIKKAYRELVKKYHPDNYKDNPLADLAKEKLQEVNEAYDILTSGKNRNYSGQNNSSYSYGNSASKFAALILIAFVLKSFMFLDKTFPFSSAYFSFPVEFS